MQPIKILLGGTWAVMLASPAVALDVDTLFPDAVPGFAAPFTLSYARHEAAAQTGTGLDWGGWAARPELVVRTGYDTAPNGAAGSALLQEAPSLLVTDTVLGLGAYAAQNAVLYPQDRAQDDQGYVLGLGERAVLPAQTITLAGAEIAAQETGFALSPVALTHPVSFIIGQARAGDEISAGMLTLQPELALNQVRFPAFAAQNRTDQRESFKMTAAPGGPLSLVVAVHATQSAYRDAIFNASTWAAEAGLDERQDGLWNIQALAGLAQRRPRFGGMVTAPVLELAADWLPTGLDTMRFSLAREIDDPDQVSAAPYTLTAAAITWHHEWRRDVQLAASLQGQNAAFIGSALRETLVFTSLSASWQVNPALALTARYDFNDRQANRLRAANEHVLSLGVTWTL